LAIVSTSFWSGAKKHCSKHQISVYLLCSECNFLCMLLDILYFTISTT
jgi:hypothetical protein